MRTFKIPFTLDREEKLFGGVVSLRQVVYLALIVAGSGLFFIMSLWLSIPLFLANAVLMLCFAFLNVYGMRFDTYFMHLTKYLFRSKFYIYRR